MKKTFKELLLGTTWHDIEEKMLYIYPEESDSLNYYKKLYWQLLNLVPIENVDGREMNFELLDGEDEIFYDEMGLGYEEWEEINLEVTVDEWKRYLSYFVSNELIKEIGLTDIVVHAFVEATYGGFKEDDIDSNNK